ncbi:hypothetical protein OC861_005401 [Tilletia horrida]|nr:hypothetical protein OC861_005401 [Tilletia horrida]
MMLAAPTAAAAAAAAAGGKWVGTAHDNPSESWTAPEDIDGALVRRTYAYFDSHGVPGDGIEDGIEYTRERTHPLPFRWNDDRRSSSRASNHPSHPRKLSTAPPLPSLDLLPQAQNVITIGQEPPSSAHSHNTSESDYLSVGNGLDTPEETLVSPSFPPPTVAAASGQQHRSPSPPDLNVVPATPILGSTPYSSRSPAPPSGSQSEPASPQIPSSPTSASSIAGRAAQKQRAFDLAPSPDDSAELDPVEQRLEQRLRNTDRYGFFSNSLSTSSHAKAVVLPSTESDVPDPVRTALKRREHEADLREREKIRIDKWSRMLTVAEHDSGGNGLVYVFKDRGGISGVAGTGKSKKLRRRCYKGIPDRWRSVAWLALLERRASATVLPSSGGKSSKRPRPPSFKQLVERYERALHEPSPYDVQIDLDVPRTMSGHLLFHTRYGHGQRALFHVLHAFSLHCPTCGYCQGMGPIAASLLVYLEPSRAYIAMVRLHDAHRLHDIFSPGFPGLVENFHVQEQLIKWLLPSLHAMLEEHGIDSSSFATKWYITLFANSVPFETQLRMWDVILLDGQDALVGIALGVLWGIQNRLKVAGEEVTFDTEPYYESPAASELNGETAGRGSGLGNGLVERLAPPPADNETEFSASNRRRDRRQRRKERRNRKNVGEAAPAANAVVSAPPSVATKMLRKQPSALSERSFRGRRINAVRKGSATSGLSLPIVNGNGNKVTNGGGGAAAQAGSTMMPSFEAVLGALTSYVIPASDGALMGWVSDLMARPDVRAKMRAAREEWAGIVKEREDRQAARLAAATTTAK